MQEFHLDTIEPGDGHALVRIAGEIDVFTAPRLRERLADLVTAGDVHIILDMSQVEFLDSTGLGVLVGGLKRVRTRDGSLTVVIKAERLVRIFRITGLIKVFSPFSTVADAIVADPHWQKTVEADAGSVEDWCRKHALT
jgi:anti-sigma B factor antagonist